MVQVHNVVHVVRQRMELQPAAMELVVLHVAVIIQTMVPIVYVIVAIPIMVQNAARMWLMERLQWIVAVPVTLHAMAVITNPTVNVFQINVQMAQINAREEFHRRV